MNPFKNYSKLQILRRLSQLLFFILLFFLFFKVNFATFMIIMIGIMIIGGAWYCGWMCAFGSLQELINDIRFKIFKRRFAVPRKIHRILVVSRYVFFILAGFLGFVILFKYDARFNFISLVNSNVLAYTAIGSIVVFIILSFFIDRPFCNYFCYDGAKYGLFSAFRLFTVKRDTKKCNNCGICDRRCPMHINISKYDDVRSLQCINCLKCIDSCRQKKALSYGFIDVKGYYIKSKDWVKKLFNR